MMELVLSSTYFSFKVDIMKVDSFQNLCSFLEKNDLDVISWSFNQYESDEPICVKFWPEILNSLLKSFPTGIIYCQSYKHPNVLIILSYKDGYFEIMENHLVW